MVINTKLYSLTPIELNTRMIESLTSYVSRLAEAHQLSTGTLIEKVLAPALDKSSLIKGRGSRFYDYTTELNAFDKQAAGFAQILSTLTGIDCIQKLSLLPLQNVFPSRNVFAKTKRWCSLCLEEWRSNDNIVYEPLLWNFRSINICVKHNALLNTACPNCAKTLPYLTSTSRNGFCSHCGCWLESNEYKTEQGMDQNQLAWANYTTRNIGNLINNEMDAKYTFGNINLFLIAAVESSGGVSAFSRSLNIPKSTVSSWIGGEHKPSLDTLLKICFAFGIEATDIFNHHVSDILADEEFIISNSIHTSETSRKAARKIDWDCVEKRLKNVIENHGSPSVRKQPGRLAAMRDCYIIIFPNYVI